MVWGCLNKRWPKIESLPKVINFITVLGLLKKKKMALLDVGKLPCPVFNILCVCVNVLIHLMPVCKVYYGIFLYVWYYVGLIMQQGPIKVIVSPDAPKTLLFLMKEYAEMLVVLKMTKIPEEKFIELTLFLSSYCQASICHCSTLNKVIELLQENMKIWIFNIDTLIAIKKKFNSNKATSSIERYRKYLKKFCTSTSVNEFQDTLEIQINNTSHDFDLIVLKLDKARRTKDTLQNFKKLAYHIFGVSSKALIHIRTEIGCVCVTWLVPTSLVSTMRAIAEQRSEKYLTNLGVLELVIGLRVVPNEGLLHLCT